MLATAQHTKHHPPEEKAHAEVKRGGRKSPRHGKPKLSDFIRFSTQSRDCPALAPRCILLIEGFHVAAHGVLDEIGDAAILHAGPAHDPAVVGRREPGADFVITG